MQIHEILDELTFNRGAFPRRALQEAVARQEEITPELLRILRETRENIDQIVGQEDYMAHIYAMYLSAQFREPRAYPLLVDFFSTPGEAAMNATEDVVTEDLQRILAAVCHGDTGPIEAMVRDPRINEYIRGAALQAFIVLVVEGEKTREEVVAYYRDLFRGGLEREPSMVWADLVQCSADLYAKELMPDIKRAFAEELVEAFVSNLSVVQDALAQRQERVLAQMQKDPRNHYIHDVIREMEWWDCFQERPKPAAPAPVVSLPVVPLAPRPGAKKVGRNDPCPCGSGKKYKKCCGG